MPQNSRAELAWLGDLMRRAGVSPDRVETMISEIIAGDVESRSIARVERELQALRGTTGDGFDQLNIDQECTSKIIENALLVFDNQALELRSALVPAMKLSNRLLIAVIILHTLIAGLLLYTIMEGIGNSNIETTSDPEEASDSKIFLFGQNSRSDVWIDL